MAKQGVQVIPLNVLLNGAQRTKRRSSQKALAAQNGGNGSGNKANTQRKQKPVVQPDGVPPHMQDEAQQPIDPVATAIDPPRHVQDNPAYQRRIVVQNVSVSVEVQSDLWRQQPWADDHHHAASTGWQPEPPPVQPTLGNWTPDVQPTNKDISTWVVGLVACIVSLIITLLFGLIFL